MEGCIATDPTQALPVRPRLTCMHGEGGAGGAASAGPGAAGPGVAGPGAACLRAQPFSKAALLSRKKAGP